MSTKILLTKNNSPWGVINRPISDNVYKHIISFPDVSLRDEFINDYLFSGEDYKTLFINSPQRALIRTSSLNGSCKVDLREYPNDNISSLLNKDTAVVEETTKLGVEYLFYTIKSAVINVNIISYELELDVFFTYWHKISIKDFTYINKGHFQRTVNGIWDTNVNNPNYNSLMSPTKMVEKKSIPVNRKDTNTVLDEMKAAIGVPQIALLFNKGGSYDAPTNTNYLVNNIEIPTPHIITIWPINFNIKYIQFSGTEIDIKIGDIGKISQNADDTVVGYMETDYWPIDFSFTDYAEIISYDALSNTLIVQQTSVQVIFLNTRLVNIGAEPILSIQLVYVRFSTLELYNQYEVDLTDYSYENLSGFKKEIANWQNNLLNISLNIVNNSTQYIIPHYLLGTKFEIQHILNFDDNDLSEDYVLINQINAGLYEGLHKEVNFYLPFIDNYANDYKIHNKSTLLSKKIGIAIDGVSAGIGIKKGQPFLSALFVREGITQVSTLRDIPRMGGEIKNDGYSTIKDYVNYKYGLSLYCNETKTYGNLWEQNSSAVFKEGVDINQLLNFDIISKSRYNFNYIQAQDVFNKIVDINLSTQIKQIINSSLEGGLTLWHYRDKTTFKGVANYNVDNVDV